MLPKRKPRNNLIEPFNKAIKIFSTKRLSSPEEERLWAWQKPKRNYRYAVKEIKVVIPFLIYDWTIQVKSSTEE